LEFWPNFFRGVLGVVRKSRGSPFCVILYFYETIFWTLPPRPPGVLLCSYNNRNRETDRQRDRETERQRGRETDRQRDIIQIFFFILRVHSLKKKPLKSFENGLGKVRLS
jgi:hypothetical protein